MAAVEIRVLGPFEVLGDGRVVVMPGDRLRVLLAVLAMSAGNPVPIGTIGTAVWGPKPPGNVQASVYTNIARLRQLLGDDIVSTGDGDYTLAIEPDAVDALRFLSLADSGDVSALDLWRGKPFTTLRSDWLDDTYGSLLAERHLALVEHRIDLDLDAGLAADLVGELSTLADQHPLRESLWTRLLTALDRAGRPAEALDRYETIRRRLASELAVDPGPRLRRIHSDLLAADAARQATTQSAVPRQLPSDVERFAGRVDALAALDRSSSVTAVHGTAGVGKTALAVHWAHRVRDRFPDGQLFVNLRGYGPGPPVQPAAALDTLLRTLGIPGPQIPGCLEDRSAMLRNLLAGRRMLVVVDNARDSDQVRPLLPDPPSQVVITSRSQLRDLDASYRITLDQLDPDESVVLLATTLRHRHRSALAELADLCGHLPLALAVAAEHAGRQPEAALTELVDDLRDRRTRLDALDLADADASPRAVFSWSYQALDPETARCFRLLSLHPGHDFGARSVAALIGTPDARASQLLDVLTNGHLIRQTGPDRYEMHDLLRVYAAELCGDVESASAVDRVYDWYLYSSANARSAIGHSIRRSDPPAGVETATFGSDVEALDWLDRERHTLLALVPEAAARGRHRVAYRTTEMVSSYLLNRYLIGDLLALQRVATASAEAAGDIRAAGTSANQVGGAYLRLADYERAAGHLQRALKLFQEAGDQLGESAALSNLGMALRLEGRYPEAEVTTRQSVELARRLGNRDAEADHLNNLAMVYIALGRYDDAAATSRQSIEARQTTEPYSLDTLGQALAGQGHHRDAVEQFGRALALYRETGDPWNECLVLTHLGVSQRAIGQPDAARASWLQALTTYDQLDVSDTPELRRSDLVDLLGTVS